MKKILLVFQLIIGIILLNACRTTEPDGKESNLKPEAKGSMQLRSAGDGRYDVLGNGYDVTKEYANANSSGFQVVDIERFKLDQPTRIYEENSNSQEYIEDYGENAVEYSKKITKKFDASLDIPLFSKVLGSSFSSNSTSFNKYDAKYIYGSYNLLIKFKRFRLNTTVDVLRNYLTPSFLSDLEIKSPEQIVNDYGTHVAIDIYTGAKMDMVFQSETTNENREYAARIGVKTGIKGVFGVEGSSEVNTTDSNKNFNKKLAYRTRGGDPSRGLVGEINLDQSTPKINLSNWQNSCNPQNAVLVDFGHNGLVPIYELINDPAKREQIKIYVTKYIKDNQATSQYIPVPIYTYRNRQYTDSYFSPLQEGDFWVKQGIAFKAFNYKVPGTVGIYIYCNDLQMNHYFTTSSINEDPNYWRSKGGPIFYVYPTEVPNSIPVYSYVGVDGYQHYLSTTTEGNYWKKVKEGPAFYVPN